MPARRIVVVLNDPPQPLGRAMGRWYYVLVRGLVERGHRVTVFAPCKTPEEIDEVRRLFPPPEYDVRPYLFGESSGLAGKWKTLRKPFSFTYSEALRADLRAELRRGFDILHLDVTWSGWLGLEHARRSVLEIAYLWTVDLADQPVTSLQERVLRTLALRAEQRLLRSYPHLVAVSPRLAEVIRRIAPRAHVEAIPFGMDLSLYPMIEAPPNGRAPTIGLIASFDWTPGRTAGERLLHRLWPEVKRRLPDARLHLAGTAAHQVFRDQRDWPDVRIDDRVTDVLGFFRGIDLQLYAPNPSTGMKFKVLESFALGVPVVTNAYGVEGLPAQDGLHAGISDDDAELVDRTVTLLQNPERLRQMRHDARRLLETHCSPPPVLDALEAVYDRVVATADR